MKTKTLFISLFFVSVLISGIFLTQKVDAVSYYNWVQNPSFITYSNYCEDGGFESGAFGSGEMYGNWSGNAEVYTGYDKEHSGVYYGLVNHAEYFWYNLTADYYVLGADIENITFWYAYGVAGKNSFDVEVHYEDGYFDSDSLTVSETVFVYEQFSIIDIVDDSRTVVAIYIEDTATDANSQYLDDVSIVVDDGEGQDSIALDTEPWGLGSNDYSGNFGYWNQVTGRLDNTSIQFSGIYTSYKLLQDLDYVDTDYIHYINLYVYGADVSESEGVTCSLVYSDRSTDYKTVYATGDGSSWEELNFGKSWIDSGKYIIQIRFNLASTDGTNDFVIDDVGLWLSVSYGFSKFDFTISPQPISIGSFDFEAYSETTYTFTGYFYNSTDYTLSINGSYQIGDGFGLHTGTMTNGLFSLQLNERTYSGSPYTLETLSVTIITDDEIFNVEISAYWYPVSGGADDTVGDVTGDFLANWFIYAVFLLVIPISITVYVGGAVNPNPLLLLVTFLGAETLMTAISLSIGLVDLWFMLVVIIMDVMIILGLMKSGKGI